jgi:hypothetical protein
VRPNAVSRELVFAIAGLATGAVAEPLLGLVSPVYLVAAAFVAILALRPETRALAGGIIVAAAFWWSRGIAGAIERCAAFDRQPGGHCTIYGTDEQQILAGVVGVAGAALVAAAIARAAARPRASAS